MYPSAEKDIDSPTLSLASVLEDLMYCISGVSSSDIEDFSFDDVSPNSLEAIIKKDDLKNLIVLMCETVQLFSSDVVTSSQESGLLTSFKHSL